MDEFNARNGVQEGETTMPGNGILPTIQVVSWLQVPQILKKLETHGSTGIKLDFPVAAGGPVKAEQLKTFFESFHARSAAELAHQLTEEIDRSGELHSVDDRSRKACGIKSGATWVAAFNLDGLSLRAGLTVSTVATVSTDDKGMVDTSLLVQAKQAVTAGRPVLYQIDESQGAASALFTQLQNFTSSDPMLHRIWVGSETYLPKATKAKGVQEILVADFLAREQEKKSLIDDLEALTSPHSDAFFDLKKIKAADFDGKDSKGVTVLENLHRIHAAEHIKGVEEHVPTGCTSMDIAEWRAHLVAAAIERLYHPGRAHQDSHGTCGAESIIRLVGFSNVGEWSRIVADLIVDGESEVKINSGTISLKPADDWTLEDLSKSRDAFDALLQSAIMRRAAEKLGFNYRNADDSFVDDKGEIQYRRDEAGKEIQETDDKGNPLFEADGITPKRDKLNGMSDECASELLTGLLGDPLVCIHAKDLETKLGEAYARRLAQRAEQALGGAYVSLKWGGDNHAVVVVGYDAVNDRIVFSNPHGEMPGLGNGDKIPGDANGPERFIVNNEFGCQSMDRVRFEKLLNSAILPHPLS